MLNTTPRRRLQQILVLVTILSVFLATEAFAVSRFINADEGGIIDLAEGISLVIPPGALEEDTMIRAHVVLNRNRICYTFGPDDIVFNKPVELVVSCQVLEDADVKDLNLYGENGEKIKPKKLKKEESLLYRIEHFSLYYHRRR